jgi:hypothetical protein
VKNLIFVDCEATGPCPGKGQLTEFGAVHYPTRQHYHGKIVDWVPSEENPAIPKVTGVFDPQIASQVMGEFAQWIREAVGNQQPVFVSDNPAFDWQWINYFFHHYHTGNPFGHSARRIGDFYAGLVGNFSGAQKWKRLRRTRHDHNPVNDAMGNLEAFERLLNGER